MQERWMEAEISIVRLEETSERLTHGWREEKQMEVMWDHIQALENQSKRNNVRLIGLNGTLLTCVQKILAEGLGVNVDAEFEIERVHRLLAPMPDPDWPPRPVLIWGTRQSARDKVVNVPKEKRGIEWEGWQLSVFPDMTKELAEKRKTFTSVKRKLQEFNVKHTLAYPATLRFRWKRKNLRWADTYLQDMLCGRGGGLNRAVIEEGQKGVEQ